MVTAGTTVPHRRKVTSAVAAFALAESAATTALTDALAGIGELVQWSVRQAQIQFAGTVDAFTADATVREPISGVIARLGRLGETELEVEVVLGGHTRRRIGRATFRYRIRLRAQD